MTKPPLVFWIMVLIAAGFNAGAQILIKLNSIEQVADLKAWTNPGLWLAVLLYAMSFALTALIYHRLPLTVISPLMTGLIFAGVALYSVIFLAETLSLARLIGMGLILLGVFLLGTQT
jgi:multidrug transporter EmrE-like cation transporter